MSNIVAINAKACIDAAKREEILRGQQLLVAAQSFYDGEIDEEEFAGFVCRYGHAATSRRVLLHETREACKGMES